MRELLFKEAIREGLLFEMERDDKTFLAGEDVGLLGGTNGVSRGFLEQFGPGRVFDTPISEAALCGWGIGAAMCGYRPIIELMYVDFVGVAFDEIFNQAPKIHYMFGGQVNVPVTFRLPSGGTIYAAAHHSQCLEALLCHAPGMKVVMPGTSADAKGLIASAIRDPNPVCFLEHKGLYNMSFPCPEGEYIVPIGKAAIAREGTDLTLVTWAYMRKVCLDAAEELAKEGVSVEVLDLRSLKPYDLDAILTSVRKTHKVMVVEEACRTAGYSAEISAAIAEHCIEELDAPILRVTAPDTPVPFSPVLEDEGYRPNAAKVIAAARKIL